VSRDCPMLWLFLGQKLVCRTLFIVGWVVSGSLVILIVVADSPPPPLLLLLLHSASAWQQYRALCCRCWMQLHDIELSAVHAALLLCGLACSYKSFFLLHRFLNNSKREWSFIATFVTCFHAFVVQALPFALQYSCFIFQFIFLAQLCVTLVLI
jgi:hypothetical protein